MTTSEYLSLTYEDKISILIESPEDLDFTPEVSAAAQYLSQWRPLLPPAYHPENQTSLDIVETLESIVDLRVNTVAQLMRVLGYRLYTEGTSLPSWSMKHIEDV